MHKGIVIACVNEMLSGSGSSCCRYSTFEQDVDVVVEDLRERVEHMKELSRNAEKYAHYNEDLAMPEVCTLLGMHTSTHFLCVLRHHVHCLSD